MTSFAFVLGTVPLAIATGASANSRHSIGTGVIGGTLAATVIAIFFIPMFYWGLQTLSAKFSKSPDSEVVPPPAKTNLGGGSPATAAMRAREGD
jgi:multidrug efflux pump